MKKFSLYGSAALCALLTGSAIQPIVETKELAQTGSPSLLSQFEKSKRVALDEANPAKEETSNRWGTVVENLELALKQAKLSMAAHAKIDDFAKVATKAEKDVQASGKSKAELATLRKLTASHEDKAGDKLKRTEHLATTLQKHTEETTNALKKGLNESAKKLTETQQALARIDAEKSVEAKQKISKENLNKSNKSEKKKLIL